MEYNKYKSKCPQRLALSTSRYDPYSRQQPQPCTKNENKSTKKTCVPLSPIDPCLPTSSSCMYYKTSTPKDLFLPFTTFTPSLADSLLEEEILCRDNLISSPSYDQESLASVPENYYDALMPSSTVSYDLEDILAVSSDVDIFSNITEEFLSYLVDDTPPVSMTINKPHGQSSKKSLVASNSKLETEFSTEPLPIFQDEIPSNSIPESTKKSTTELSFKSSDSRLQCEFCPKKFKFKTSWKVHMRIHTGEKPYTCALCSRSFSDNSTYVKHLRTHSKEKPYSCDVCNKSFSQSGNLNRHKKIHKS